jgi:hypothetical protein
VTRERLVQGLEGAALFWVGAHLVFPMSAMLGIGVAVVGFSLIGASLGGD